MNKTFNTLWLLLKREIVPSGDNTEINGYGQRLKQWLTYHIPFFYSPIIGIVLLLALVSYAGLCIIGSEQEVKNRFEHFRTSSFTALFGKGLFFIQDRKNIDYDRFIFINRWMELTVQDIPDLMNISDISGEKKIFSSVKPFSWIHLTIKMKGSHVGREFQKGMGLPLYGNYADEALIDEIKKSGEIIKGVFSDRSEEGIIVSVDGMKRYDYYKKEEYPDFLWVKLSSNRKVNEDKFIPLRLCVVKKLPYQFHYIISMRQLNLLKNKYYYKETNRFELGFNGSDHNSILDQITEQLPVSDISNLYKKGTVDTVSVNLKNKVKLIEILKIAINHNARVFLNTERHTSEKKFKGAIFHLNFEIKENFIWNKEQIYTIQNFMDMKDVKVEGELIELLSEMMNTQENLQKLQFLFIIIPVIMSFILLLFFIVVLHSRMHRIGILRVFGTSDYMIMTAFCLGGLFLMSTTYPVSLFVLNYIYSPMELQVSVDRQVFKLFLGMFICTEFGLLMPVLYFLRTFQPSEMVSYSS